MQSQSSLRKKRGFRIAAELAAIWFALFALLVPIIHHHADELSPESVAAAMTAASPSSAHLATIGRQHDVIRLTTDDCPICQWFSVGFTPNGAGFILALFAAALVVLLLDVRRAALCDRPRPRLGLRAPPALSC